MTYHEHVSRFLKVLSQSPDLDAARPVIEANLHLLRNPLFMPAFIATISQPEIGELDRWLINTALTESLKTLEPEKLGPEGLIIALLFSEEDFSALVDRYADYIDIPACQRMMNLADTLTGETHLPTVLTSVASKQLRQMAERFAMLHSMDYVRPLLEMQDPKRDPQELLAAIVRLAQEIPPWLVAILRTVSERMLATAANAHARIAWLTPHAVCQAHQKLQQGAHPDPLTPALHIEMFNMLVGWARAEPSPREREVLTSFAIWLLWGPSLPRPYELLLTLDQVRNQENAWALVSEEPWFLTQPALAILKGNFAHSPALSQIVGWLEYWQTELIQPDKNPLVLLADRVQNKSLSIDAAIEIVSHPDGLDDLEVPHLAAIDEWIQDELIDKDSARAEVLARLNYAAAQTLGNGLMQGYAAFTLGSALIDRRPLAEVLRPLEQAADIGRQLNHPLLLGQALHAQGQAYAAQDHFAKALTCFKEAEDIARRLPLWTGRKQIVLLLAQVYLEMNQTNFAEQCLLRFDCFPEHLQEPSHELYRYWFLRGGVVFQHSNIAEDMVKKARQIEEAITLLERARQIAETIRNPRLIHEAVQNIARLYASTGRRQEAQAMLQEQVNTPSTQIDDETRIETLETQAAFAIEQGMWQHSKDLLERALLQAQQADLRLHELRIHILLGRLHNQMEQPLEAHSHWTACRVLLTTIGSWPVEEMEIQLSRALTFNLEGEHLKALIVCRDALSRARQMNHQNARLLALKRLTKIYLDMNRLARALTLIRIVEHRSDEADQRVLRGNQATILMLQARTAWAEGQALIARELSEQAEAIYRNLAEEARQKTELADIRLGTLYNLGLLYREPTMANPTLSARYFCEAVEVLDAMRFNLADNILQRQFMRGESFLFSMAPESAVAADLLQQRFVGDKSYLYRMALESALAIDDQRGAIEVAEMARARILGGRIAHLESLPKSLPQKKRQEYQQSFVRFQQALNAWLSVGMGISDDPFQRARTLSKSPTLQDRQQRIVAYDDAWKELELKVKEIRTHGYRDFQPVMLLPKPSFDEIRGMLDAAGDSRLAFVHLQMLDNETVALISTIHQPEPLVVRLPFSRAHLGFLRVWEGYGKSWERKLGPSSDIPEGIRKQLESNLGQLPDDFLDLLGRIDSLGDPGRVEAVTLMLCHLVWRDLHPQLQNLGITRLILFPDNVFSLLPIHAAPLEDPETQGRQPSLWVPDIYEVALVPSAQILRLLQERVHDRPNVLDSGVVFAQVQGLPLAAAAVSMINKHLRAPARVVWDTESYQERLKQMLAGEQTLLHIEAHGRFDANNPEQTELHMPYDEKAPDGSLMRWLTLADISRDLSLEGNRLTVLAACESSVVDLARTAEFVGLPAAFLIAGAPVVLAALWRVDELATLLLLNHFYNELSAGYSIAEALRRAQVHLRHLTRDEVIAELTSLRDDCQRAWEDSSTGTAGRIAFDDVQGTLDEHISNLQQKGEALRHLWEQLQGMDRESAAQLLLDEGKTTIGWPNGDGDVGTRLSQLQATIEWQLSDKLAYRGWDTEAARTWLEDQAMYPYAEPYFWGGFQGWGAAIYEPGTTTHKASKRRSLMRTLSKYLAPEPEGYQPQAIILLSGEFDPLAELQVAAKAALAEKWRAIRLLDANEQPLGIVAVDDLKADINKESAQSRQRGSQTAAPIIMPLPIIYVCSQDRDHPRYVSVRRGSPPPCSTCGSEYVELQPQK